MHVIYRWKVKAGREQAFIGAWKRARHQIRQHCEGALGSLLARSTEAKDGGTLVEIARFRTFEHWRRFQEEVGVSPPTWAAESFEVMSSAAELIETEALQTVVDLSATSALANEEELDHALEETFPASDPPSTTRK